MSTNDKLADAPITHDEAAEAVESMDDCAKMDVSVDPFGPRATLERYIEQQRAASLAAPPAQGEWRPIDGTDAEVLREFIRVCRDEKPVGAWPGERVCAAIERAMKNERPFRFIAEPDMAPKRGHNGRGGDSDRPYSGPRSTSPQPAPAPVQVDDSAGIARAAAYIQQKADDYAEENCGLEPDTNAATYRYGQAGEDYHHSLIELAEEVAGLAKGPCTVPPAGWQCSRTKGHSGPCAATPGAQPPARGEAELLSMIDDVAADLTDHKSLAYEKLRKVRAAIATLAQQRVPDAVRLCAKPQQWTEDGVARASGWREWSEGLMGYHISFDPQEEPDNRYTAACGEGEPESFATLEEAQQWCQSDADDWIRKIAMIDQQQEARGNGE